MSAGRDTVWDIRGGGGTEKHKEGGNIQGDNKKLATMTTLQGGFDSRAYDGVLEEKAHEVAIY